MDIVQAERVLKAVLDGIEEYRTIADRAGVDPVELAGHAAVLDRAIQLMRGFYKYGHENMKPVGLPPPPNPYLDKACQMDDQCPEYFAFEAVQRNGMTDERCIWTCGQLGLDEETAREAMDNITMPWREKNGWKTYAQLNSELNYVLMDKPPVKLKRHLERLLEQLQK